MRPSPITVWLTLGNVVLLRVVFHQTRLLRRAVMLEPLGHQVALSDASASTGVREEMENLTRERISFARQRVIQPPGPMPSNWDWSQVEAPDYPTYIKNLRAIGVPEPTIRDIVTADGPQTFASNRAEVLAPEYRDFRFWAVTAV